MKGCRKPLDSSSLRRTCVSHAFVLQQCLAHYKHSRNICWVSNKWCNEWVKEKLRAGKWEDGSNVTRVGRGKQFSLLLELWSLLVGRNTPLYRHDVAVALRRPQQGSCINVLARREPESASRTGDSQGSLSFLGWEKVSGGEGWRWACELLSGQEQHEQFGAELLEHPCGRSGPVAHGWRADQPAQNLFQNELEGTCWWTRTRSQPLVEQLCIGLARTLTQENTTFPSAYISFLHTPSMTPK